MNVDEPTVDIVPFETEHAAGFAALVAETLREFGFEPDAEHDGDLDDPAGTYAALWIAVAGGAVVGSVALRHLGGKAFMLKRMYLSPACRGRGVGKRLLATALDWARANHAGVVRLDTTERMVAARHLYESVGFVQVPGAGPPRQGQQRLVYELTLRAP